MGKCEIEFKHIFEEDTLEVNLHLTPYRFNKIAEMINNGQAHLIQLCLGQIYGFYSEWSPSIFTTGIKILTTLKEQEVIMKNDCEIIPPKLGKVGEFYVTFMQRHKLNPKQNLIPVNINKLFDEGPNYEEISNKEQEYKIVEQRKYSLILSHLARNKAALDKILVPIWLILAPLCIFLLK